MIEDSIMIHDRYQFQVKLTYEVDEKKRKAEYQVDNFMFLPKSLGINPKTYTNKEFYSDIQSYIRYKTPVFTLHELSQGKGPLEKISQGKDVEKHLKLFCCIAKSAIREYTKSECFNPKEYCSHIIKIRESFRSLDIKKEHFSTFTLCDEDFSLLIRSYTFMKIASLKNGNSKDILIRLAKHEDDYRKDKDYPSIPTKVGSNEYFLFRKNNLKKYVESALYLKTHEGVEGKVIDAIFSGIAAGFAMVFATAITFFAQAKFGNFTSSFFVALVLGYIFKDTIKGALKSYLKRSKKNFFDHKTKIYSKKKMIGNIKESFDFEKEDDLPDKVLLLRNKDIMNDIEHNSSGETIIKHSKKIVLVSDELKMNGYENLAINDISRIDVKHFLSKMSDPNKNIDLIEDGKIISVTGETVYHINMVLRFQSGQSITYKRLRLLLNRKGIKNIEEIDSRHEDLKDKLSWSEILRHLPVKNYIPK